MTDKPIYLDHQATTPTDPRVVEAMLPFFNERFGNPHSTAHAFGRDAEAAVEAARERIAAPIGAEAREIVFTSGATESNNLAIKGAARFHAGRKDHLITPVTEHKCVLESVKRMEREGFRVTWLNVGADGLLDPDEVKKALTAKTALVSVMAANNEIGVLQPIAEIAALCREAGAYFHTDAAQAYGKIPLDVQSMGIDLMSLSGHKVYGPKGIGVLYVRRRPRVRLLAEMDGGGQERGLRSGTLPAPLCVGLGEAARIAAGEIAAEAMRLEGLRDRLLVRLRQRVPGLTVNGDMARRLPGNLNVSFPGASASRLMAAVPDVAVSTGSACTSASVEPSYVLRALGISDERAAGSLRIGLGRFTTEAEVDRAADRLAEAATRLRGEGQGAAAE